MSATRIGRGPRALATGLAVVLACLLSGDRGAHSASAANSGIDPFDVLDLQVKPFVAVLFDTSGSMKNPPVIPPGIRRYAVGGDDPAGRMWQAKRALRDVGTEFRFKLNMGLLTFSPLATQKALNNGADWDGDGRASADPLNQTTDRRDGVFNYVSNSPGARLWGWDPNNSGQLEYATDTYLCPDLINGSVNISSSGATVTGTNAFTNLRVGDQIVRGTQTAIITVKTSNSNVTVSPAFSPALSNVSFQYRTGVSGYFCDIRDNNADYNTASNFAEVFQSFSNRAYFSVPYPWRSATGGWGGTSPELPAWRTGFSPADIIGYGQGPTAAPFYPAKGWLPGAVGPIEPEAQPNTTFNEAYRVPICNPLLNECRYYLQSHVYRSGRKFHWDLNRATSTAAAKLTLIENFDCSTLPPPPGLTDDTVPGARPCIVFVDKDQPANPDRTAVFYYSTGIWVNQGGGGCVSPVTLQPVPPCNPAAGAQTAMNNVIAQMRLELPMNPVAAVDSMVLGVGNPNPNSAPALDGQTVNGQGEGIRSDGGTPIGPGLNYINNNDVFPVPPVLPVGVTQKRFVMVITDGEDRCSLNVALEAANLYNNASNRRQAELMFVVYTSDASAAVSNRIAQAGSGANSSTTWVAGPSEVITCPAGRNCRDAIRANTIQDLKDQLRAAFSLIANQGEFGTSRGTIPEDVYEYVTLAGAAFDPTSPISRYQSTFPVVFQSNLAMPGFEGKLKAFRSGVTTPIWEAGQSLVNRINAGMGVGGQWTFATLHAGVSTAPDFVPAATAKLRRRIFTNSRNGVNTGNVPLWPPTTDDLGVAPSNTVTYPAGKLDGSSANGTGLAIGGLTFAELQTRFKACQGSVPADLPPDCADAAKQQPRALKEAREKILAWVAGAEFVLENDLPRRDTATKEILYKARTWVLPDSTIATPAVVGPPGEQPPLRHPDEWTLYRDGPRDVSLQMVGPNPIENGYGLRNPDRDDPTAATNGNDPVMTVAYVGSNLMVHAFRAGPQKCTGAGSCPPATFEDGGEELWGFVPFDQLHILQDRMIRGQSRTDPIYGVSASMRFGDVFVPGPYTAPNGVAATGRWRTLMFFGRGPGGKMYTAMDITGPGPFTKKALETQLPTVLWSRGNPDTQDGTPTGLANSLTNGGTDDGVNDGTAYLTMGETWSVPSLDSLTPGATTNFNREWVLWAGSGYSDTVGEGRHFYTIDALTGDILFAVDVGSALTFPAVVTQNVIVANVSGFNPVKLDEQPDNAADGPATGVFVGDIHGRLWKFDATSLNTKTLVKDYTANQPIGVAVTALNMNTTGVLRPHIFGATGNDNRLFPPPAVPNPAFIQFGLRDDGATTTDLFVPIPFPERFRGTVQPLGIFNSADPTKNFVFFVGTQFNTADTSTNCTSNFDSILTALKAATGVAAYDLSAGGDDRFATWRGQKVQNITSRGGKVVLDVGIGAGSPPPPPAPPATQNPNNVASVFTTAMRFGSTVCH